MNLTITNFLKKINKPIIIITATIAFISSLVPISQCISAKIEKNQEKKNALVVTINNDILPSFHFSKTPDRVTNIIHSIGVNISNYSTSLVKIIDIEYKRINNNYHFYSYDTPKITNGANNILASDFPFLIPPNKSNNLDLEFILIIIKDDKQISFAAKTYLETNSIIVEDFFKYFVNEEEQDVSHFSIRIRYLYKGQEYTRDFKFGYKNTFTTIIDVDKGETIGYRLPHLPIAYIGVPRTFSEEENKQLESRTADELLDLLKYNQYDFNISIVTSNMLYEYYRYDEAKEVLLKSKPSNNIENSLYFNNLGVIEYIHFDKEKGLEYLEKALKYKIDYIYPYLNIVEFHHFYNNYLLLDQWVKNYFDNIDIFSLEMIWRLYEAQKGIYNYKLLSDNELELLVKRNINYYKESLKEGVEIGNINNQIATSYVMISEYRDSLRYFLLAYNQGLSTERSVLNNLATTYIHIENFELALKYALESLKEDADNYLAYYHIGYISWKNGDYVKSMDYYKKSILLNPDFNNSQNELDQVIAEYEAWKGD